MAKREIRAIQATEDIATVIDHGADVDTQIKNLTFEDKGCKSKITDLAQKQLEDGELSVRLVGNISAATVSSVVKLDIDVNSDQFASVNEAIKNGLLAGIVERNVTLVVPPAEIERAAEELQKLGIQATVLESIKVSGEKLRDEMETGKTASATYVNAIHALSNCLKREVSFRVKYDRV